jgi:hypothetical protein
VTFAILAIAALAIGVFVVVYHGPGRSVLRGNVGDVAATMLVYALVGVAWWRGRRATRAIATFAIAIAVELFQIVWHARSLAGELVLGSTFDPWDIVAYAVGVAVGVAWESVRTSCNDARDANRAAADSSRV